MSRTGERYPVNGRIQQSREKKKKKVKMLVTFGKTLTIGILRVQGKNKITPATTRLCSIMLPGVRKDNIGLSEKPTNIKLCMGDGEG